jgi:hypothetical protein
MPEYLIEAETRDAAGTITMARFHSGKGFNRAGDNYFWPLVKNPLQLRRNLFASGTTSGSVATGSGAVDLINVSGQLDWIASAGLAGGKLTVMSIEPGAAIGSVVTLAVLTMEQPEVSFDQISLRVRDRLYDLEQRQAQTLLYAGTNVSGAGLEGGPNDLKGKVKPLLLGRGMEIPALLVGPSQLIYQVSTAAADISGISDRGNTASITIGTPYSSQADMLANAPAPGFARVWSAGGMFRLGSPPTGLITCNATAGATAADRTAAQILRALAIGPGGISAGDVVTADVTALDAANSAEVGLWLSAETSVRAAMEVIANSIGAWFGFDRLGRLRMGRLVAPSGPAVATLRQVTIRDAASTTEFPIIDAERVTTSDEGRGVPPWRFFVTYQPIEATQTSDLAGSVTPERRIFLAQMTRQVSADAPAVLNQFPSAGKRTYDTRIFDATAAQAECNRLRDLHSVLRSLYRIRMSFGAAQALLIDLGSVVRLTLPRFGMNAGRLHIVTNIDFDAAAGVAVLDLWG